MDQPTTFRPAARRLMTAALDTFRQHDERFYRVVDHLPFREGFVTAITAVTILLLEQPRLFDDVAAEMRDGRGSNV